MTLYVGTSGYSYKEWKGSFYPERLPATKMLAYYAERFLTVEINSTFRRMQPASVLEKWASQVSPGFKFVLKAPQQITHFQRLQETDTTTSHFLHVARALGDFQGPLLFQLPPNMKKDLPRLEAFLELVAGPRVAFEFRDASWFDDEVFALLRRHNVALCLAEAESDLEVPFMATADWGYLRLRRPDYSPADLKAWMKRVQSQNWDDTFVFFKHEDEGLGPQFAAEFLTYFANR